MDPTTETTLRFTGDWPVWPVLAVALALAGLMLWLYRREIRFQSQPLAWAPAALRAAAVFILVLALAGPVLRRVTIFRQLGRIILAVDGSASMKLTDESASAAAAESSTSRLGRWSRAEKLILGGPNPVLKKLAESQDVELTVLRGQSIQRLWWWRQNGRDTSGTAPTAFEMQPEAGVSDLDQTLREAVGAITPGTALVLLTDGQHNTDGSPEELASSMRESGIPMFTVGFGTEVPPPDLSLVDAQLPESVFAGEQLQGRIVALDSMPPGVPAVARIESQGRMLWEKPFVTNGKGEREFDFAFPVQSLPQPVTGSADPTLRPLTIQIAASGEQSTLEKTRSNNSRETAVHLLAKKRKALILEGRARWETRYIHNHFDRDERWQVTLAIDDMGGTPAGSPVQKLFPATRDELLSYDLVILGDLSPSRLNADQVKWLVEFVEKRGGGLIAIDGDRGNLAEWSRGVSANLLPVAWKTTQAAARNTALAWRLEPEGQSLAALRLSDSPTTNATLWPTLPGALWTASVEALPGSRVLATLGTATDSAGTPAMVFRPDGAGAVLYVASDALWRWRYQVADLYHQRLWMQIAAWIAAPPFQAEGRRVSLGSDRLRYTPGEQAEIRVRLRDERGDLVANGSPRAYLQHNGTPVATLELEPDPTHAGVYRALTPPLKSGSYAIAVAESATAPRSDVSLSLRVEDPGNHEWASLTMNRQLLETMATNSGGRFIREEQAASELPALLQALDRKQTVTRETLLWSSWWWFGIVILLLTLEWLLRKRLRLV